MSSRSKLVLRSSFVFTAATVVGVFWLKDMESTNRRIGIAKTDVRRQKRLENMAELDKQEKLREEMLKDQK
ncbi:hypothetical protein HK096_010715, partial [Nowakowskiella sp. JEL0078]